MIGFQRKRCWIGWNGRGIKRNGAMGGMGKPEPLRYRNGYSRRIDGMNRLEYEIDELQNIKIISCRGHYEE